MGDLLEADFSGVAAVPVSDLEQKPRSKNAHQVCSRQRTPTDLLDEFHDWVAQSKGEPHDVSHRGILRSAGFDSCQIKCTDNPEALLDYLSLKQ